MIIIIIVDLCVHALMNPILSLLFLPVLTYNVMFQAFILLLLNVYNACE